MWFELRREFEDAMERSFNGQVRRPLISGEYEEENFLGYCHRSGGYCHGATDDSSYRASCPSFSQTVVHLLGTVIKYRSIAFVKRALYKGG